MEGSVSEQHNLELVHGGTCINPASANEIENIDSDNQKPVWGLGASSEGWTGAVVGESTAVDALRGGSTSEEDLAALGLSCREYCSAGGGPKAATEVSQTRRRSASEVLKSSSGGGADSPAAKVRQCRRSSNSDAAGPPQTRSTGGEHPPSEVPALDQSSPGAKEVCLLAATEACMSLAAATHASVPDLVPDQDQHPSAERLRSWGVRKRLREEQIESLVLLLDKQYLRNLRIRKKSRAWPKVPQANNFRHHFYRQTAHILGWIEQQVFDQDFVEIVRSSFPDESHATTAEIMEEGKRGKAP